MTEDFVEREKVLEVVERLLKYWGQTVSAGWYVSKLREELSKLPSATPSDVPEMPRSITSQLGCPELLRLLFRDRYEADIFKTWVQGRCAATPSHKDTDHG